MLTALAWIAGGLFLVCMGVLIGIGLTVWIAMRTAVGGFG